MHKFFSRQLFWIALLIASCANQNLPPPSKENLTSEKETPIVNRETPLVNADTSSLEPVCQIAPPALNNLPSYKKKIAVAAFPLVRSQDAPDIPKISYEWPLFLARALRASGDFIVRDIEEVNLFDNLPNSFYLIAPRTDTLQDNFRIADLAEKIDTQFIISGVIQDFSFTQSNFNLFGLSFDTRMVRVELFIHDGWSGALIDKQLFEQQVTGKVYFPDMTHLESTDFLNSNIGLAFQKIINNQVRQIQTKLNLFPLIEKVLRVEDHTVVFNAGAEQNINVGDIFLVSSTADKYAEAVYYNNSRLRGYSEKAKSQLTVQQVQPLFSLGTLDIKVQVYPSDIVRSW